ncbi:hypothetical protein AVEN_44804-1 [Araneus ventricosus]|uniref:Uncharacterized protein n=1 Tax=Araneus ventricosus TaxID=182803 RepID=A0A4Y2NYH0_ARAVE|nr:hypothetical protein AVEN_44804-1 [Araneus ventricosus]
MPVTKIVLWVYGVKCPTRRIMENEGHQPPSSHCRRNSKVVPVDQHCPLRSTVGLRVERRHHLQSVCLQDVVLVDQPDFKRVCSLVGPQHPPDSPDLAPSDFHLTMR